MLLHLMLVSCEYLLRRLLTSKPPLSAGAVQSKYLVCAFACCHVSHVSLHVPWQPTGRSESMHCTQHNVHTLALQCVTGVTCADAALDLCYIALEAAAISVFKSAPKL